MEWLWGSRREQSWPGGVRLLAGPAPVCIAAGVWFWCAAVGKFYLLLRQGYWFSSITGVLGPGPLLALCAVELTLACLVVARGPASTSIRWLVASALVVLAVADLVAVIRGETHCGCFGVVSPPVWLVGVVNPLLAVLLWRCGGAVRSGYGGSEPCRSLWNGSGYLVAAMVAIPVALPGLLGQTPLDFIRRNVIGLQPQDWVGRTFPVELFTGDVPVELPPDGVVVLYRSDCGRCCRVLSSLPRAAGSFVLVDLARGVGSCPSEGVAKDGKARVLPLRTDVTFALSTVPQFVSLRKGIVSAVSNRPPEGPGSRFVARATDRNR